MGILISTLVGIPLGVRLLPAGVNDSMSLPLSVSEVPFKLVGYNDICSWDVLILVYTFLFVDIFDTVGTLAGVASKADMLGEDGKLPRVEKALTADAIGTIAGASLGTSTITTFVESASGVAAG